MGIRYYRHIDGGFTVGSTDTGLASYAAPNSGYANMAKTMPVLAASCMILSECGNGEPDALRKARDRNWLERLERIGVDA